MRPRFQFKLWQMMVAVAAMALVLAVIIGPISEAREAANRSQCANNLKQIGLGLHDYHSAFDCFPPGTVPNSSLPPTKRLSWFTLVTLFLEQILFHLDFDKPWDVPPNNVVMASGVRTPSWPAGEYRIFQCPSSHHQAKQQSTKPGLTSYVGVAGLGPDAPTLPKGHERCGVFGYDRFTSIKDIHDGTANTMMVVETNRDNGPWTAGGTPTIRGVDPATRPYVGQGRPFGGIHKAGTNVLMADGSVKFIKSTIEPRVFEWLSTIAGGESADFEPF